MCFVLIMSCIIKVLRGPLNVEPDLISSVLPHHYTRTEYFGVDDAFMDIPWTWLETRESTSPDPTDSTNW